MNGVELKEWRRAMGFTQQQAGDELGVTRATIQNWEYVITPIPLTVPLACRQLLRRKKRRRVRTGDFGLLDHSAPEWVKSCKRTGCTHLQGVRQ
jgi:Helix-turn-helix